MKQFAYLTDLHIDDHVAVKAGVNPRKNFQRVLEDLRNRKLNHIVFGGDLAEPAALPWLFEQVKDFTVHAVLGNHDYFNEVSCFFTRGTEKELYYTLDEEDYRFVFLDSSSTSLSEEQVKWLEGILETDKRLLIFIHHPLLAIESAVDKLYPLKDRERIVDLLQKTGKDVSVFCGHCHTSDETSLANIHQIITPAVSFQVKKGTESLEFENIGFGYRIISLTPKSLHSQLITINE